MGCVWDQAVEEGALGRAEVEAQVRRLQARCAQMDELKEQLAGASRWAAEMESAVASSKAEVASLQERVAQAEVRPMTACCAWFALACTLLTPAQFGLKQEQGCSSITSLQLPHVHAVATVWHLPTVVQLLTPATEFSRTRSSELRSDCSSGGPSLAIHS